EVQQAGARRVRREPLEIGHEAADVDPSGGEELADVPVGDLAVDGQDGAECVLAAELIPGVSETFPVGHRTGSLTQVDRVERVCQTFPANFDDMSRSTAMTRTIIR